jgi:hypothetical protein
MAFRKFEVLEQLCNADTRGWSTYASRNITTPQTQPISGFGKLNPASVGSPRTGQFVGSPSDATRRKAETDMMKLRLYLRT